MHSEATFQRSKQQEYLYGSMEVKWSNILSILAGTYFYDEKKKPVSVIEVAIILVQ